MDASTQAAAKASTNQALRSSSIEHQHGGDREQSKQSEDIEYPLHLLHPPATG